MYLMPFCKWKIVHLSNLSVNCTSVFKRSLSILFLHSEAQQFTEIIPSVTALYLVVAAFRFFKLKTKSMYYNHPKKVVCVEFSQMTQQPYIVLYYCYCMQSSLCTSKVYFLNKSFYIALVIYWCMFTLKFPWKGEYFLKRINNIHLGQKICRLVNNSNNNSKDRLAEPLHVLEINLKEMHVCIIFSLLENFYITIRLFCFVFFFLETLYKSILLH